jgi:hypothetical protein
MAVLPIALVNSPLPEIYRMPAIGLASIVMTKSIPWHIFLDNLAPKRENGFPDYTDLRVFHFFYQ